MSPQPNGDPVWPPDPSFLRSEEVCQKIPGLTFRKLDYWVRIGMVAACDGAGTIFDGDYQPGSGSTRFYSPEEVAVIEHMVRLTYAGFMLQAASQIARLLVDGGTPNIVRLRSRSGKNYVLTEGSPL